MVHKIDHMEISWAHSGTDNENEQIWYNVHVNLCFILDL